MGHTKKVQQRSNKGIGTTNQIMGILESTYFGKYYFEVAMVLRDSLLLSSLLLNSEAWVNYTEKDVRILEKCDEILLSRILDCDANTSNALKYLELGIVPVRFEIMRRKLGFLQYILKQEKDSMMFQVFNATCENSVKNDFVFTCKKYLETLKIKLTYEEIENMSKFSFNKMLKEKIKIAAFCYLKCEQSKQEKIKDITYSKLEMQEYLADGDRNINLARQIYKARGQILDIKLQKRWKYSDKLCTGCNLVEESGEEILKCKSIGENEDGITYDCFFSDLVENQVSVAKLMMKKLEIRRKLREEVT